MSLSQVLQAHFAQIPPGNLMCQMARLTEAGCTCKKVWFTPSGQTCDHYCQEPQINSWTLDGSRFLTLFSRTTHGLYVLPWKQTFSLWKFDGWFRWIPRFGGQKRPVFRGKLGKLAVKLQGCNPEQDSERHGSRNGSGKDFVLPKKWDHRVIECWAAFR